MTFFQNRINVFGCALDPSDDFEMADLEMSLEILSRIKQNVRSNNPFRNVTKIQFGISFKQDYGMKSRVIFTMIEFEYNLWFLASFTSSRNRNELREKVLAHLISMTTQLRCLRIEQFHWLFHTIQNVCYYFYFSKIYFFVCLTIQWIVHRRITYYSVPWIQSFRGSLRGQRHN